MTPTLGGRTTDIPAGGRQQEGVETNKRYGGHSPKSLYLPLFPLGSFVLPQAVRSRHADYPVEDELTQEGLQIQNELHRAAAGERTLGGETQEIRERYDNE